MTDSTLENIDLTAEDRAKVDELYRTNPGNPDPTQPVEDPTVDESDEDLLKEAESSLSE